MAREKTVDECRLEFIRHMAALVNYWENESRQPDSKDKLEGLAFSFLVLLDGGSGMMPGFQLTPISTQEDKDFWKSEGENWWPSDKDIGGALHEQWHQVLRATKLPSEVNS